MKTKRYLILLVVFASFGTVSGAPALSQGEKDQTEYIQNLNARIQHLQEILRETKKTLMNRDRELKERERQYEERVRLMKEMIEGNQKTIHDMAELVQELNNKYKRIAEKIIEQRKQLRTYEMVKAASEYLLAENPKLTESISPQEKRQQRVYGSSTLHGLEGVSPVVILESPERKELGLAEQSLRTLVEGTLSKAGIRILRLGYDGVERPDPNIARLIITVETASDKTGEEPIYAYRISSQLLQSVQLARNHFIETVAPSWSTTNRTRLYVGEADSSGVGEDIVILMNRQMNEFINDYLAANPKPSSLPTEQTREDIGATPREIVVEQLESWRPSGGWGSVDRRYTRNARIETTTGHPRFVVEDANSLHVWLRSDVRVPISSYPIAVLKYRAENIGKDWYCIWMDDGTGPYNGCEVFELADLTADGKTHECRFDLRKERLVHTGRTKKLKENGTITTMALGVKSSETTPAYVEIIDLRFLQEEPAGMPQPKDEKAREIVVTQKEDVAAPKEIVIPPIGRWSTAAGWGSDLYRYTRNARTNTTDGHLEFIVEDANSLHVWKRYGLSVSIADYPIAVFTYRAQDVAPGWYTIWMDDGAGPWGGCVVFRPGNLIVDGKKHEIRADLRKVRDEHKHKILKLDEKGTIKGMALGVRAGNKTPAVLEFIDLRFLPE